MKKIIKQINKIEKIGMVIIIVIFLLLSSIGYYTNTGKFLEDCRKDDGYSGEGLERDVNDFIVDGCGSGTILDTVTGLCWDKNMYHAGTTKQWATSMSYLQPIWDDGTKSYSYPVGRTSVDYPAFEYCEVLTNGGHSDWRVPTEMELLTLIDEIDTSYGSICATLSDFDFTNCQIEYYWATGGNKKYTTDASAVAMNGGSFSHRMKDMNYNILCVR